MERPKVTMKIEEITEDMADSVREEPMDDPGVRKPGVSEEKDPAKAAQEILSALDEGLDVASRRLGTPKSRFCMS